MPKHMNEHFRQLMNFMWLPKPFIFFLKRKFLLRYIYYYMFSFSLGKPVDDCSIGQLGNTT